MKIVILDGYAINPGDLTWQPIEQLGHLVVYPRTAAGDVVARSRECEVILTNKTIVSRKAIDQLPALRCIGVLATGYNIVDVTAAAEKGITVTNVPGYSSDSAAQLVFGFILEFFGHISEHLSAVRDGAWTTSPDWTVRVAPIQELGIVGLGAIGRKVALIGHAFGMNVIASGGSTGSPANLPGFLVHRYPLEELLAMSDVVSLHCPLTEQTRHLINAERIARMKPTAILINTARGPLVDVDEDALADALQRGYLVGVGLDVLGVEPPAPDNRLLNAPRCLLTPHIAWGSIEARRRLIQVAANNIRAFQDGKPINVVQ
jgi:glycerate dehydrogenase